MQAGPQLCFLISAKSKSGNVSTDIKNNINTMDFALGAGVGYVNPETGIGVDTRYNPGLSNINDESPAKSTNLRFQIGAFYLFKHK